jgi:predicted RNA-binding protein with PUA-like domain
VGGGAELPGAQLSARRRPARRPGALDPASDYYDPKATADDPRWYMVDVEWVETFPRPVPLDALRGTPGLEKMLVINKSRLSVQPVTDDEYEIVVRLGREGV